MKKLLAGLILAIGLYLTKSSWATIAVTPGSGKTVQTDTVNSVEYQAVKIIDGTLNGTSSMTVTSGGAITAIGMGIVSSTTLTTSGPGLAQGTTAPFTITNIGQLLTTGIPYADTLSTFNINISSTIALENILVSSAPAGQYTYLCGCSLANSSASNVLFTIYKSSSVPATNELHPFQVPANSQGGLWPGCANPFFRSALAGQITERTTIVVSSLAARCQYYQAP